MNGRLVGRERECARLTELLVPGSLVTLTGPGGVGKTRLAVELASRLQTGGQAVPIAFLGSIPADADAHAVVDELGFESLSAAAVVLAERESAAIVLDNCEHVLTAIRDVVDALRATAPELTIVTTTRQPLGLDDEHVFLVEPLGMAAPGGVDAGTAPAVELFLERAALAGAVLDSDPRLLADVAELCRRLDGLPLAIELAAARTRAIAPGDLLAVVDERLDVLRRASPGGERHDTMWATIELSTATLPPAERTFFRRLGVFTGPFDLGLAHAVAGEPGSDRARSIESLAQLVERSLVSTEHAGSTTRYRLLELLHDHAEEDLRRHGELAAVEERFVAAMLAVADQIVSDALERWDAGLLSVASSQFANLARACELCLERDPGPPRAYRLLLPMFAALHEKRPNEVWDLGSRVLERWPDQPAPWRPEALAVIATAAAILGHNEDVTPLAAAVVDDPEASVIAAALADRAWGLAVRTADPAGAARHFRLAREAASGLELGSLAGELQLFEAGELDVAGDHDRARALVDEVLARANAAEDLFLVVLGHLVRSRVRLRAGDGAGANSDLVAADAAAAKLGVPWWDAGILRTKAAAASLGPGGWAGSTAQWRAALDSAVAEGAMGEVSVTLRAAAAAALHLGERDVAAVLWACAPRSTTITVLAELFPDAAAELAQSATPPPAGQGLIEALTVARTTLSGAAVEEPAAAPVADVAGARTGELARDGDGWRIAFAGRTTRVRDMKGIGDLVVLLARPGKEVHALELMGARDVGREAGPALDDRARRAYQQRIIELQRDIDEARANHDERRAERAEVELDALVEQLSEAFGLGGRARKTGSSAERARSAVTYRIRSAIRKLSEVHPELGRHLGNSVRTGTWCSYQPETDVAWTVDRPG